MGARSQPHFFVHVVPGLEDIAAHEIEMRGYGRIERVIARFDERTSVLLLGGVSSARDLLTLRTVEDVFVLAAQLTAVPSARVGVQTIRAGISRSPELPRAADIALATRPRRRGKTTFRVIARKAGEHAFRRVDLQRATEAAVLDRFPAWRLVEDEAQLEMWVQLVGPFLLAGIRVSDASMRQRTYRTSSLPAALKPTVAAAMVMLSEPRDDDVFLDPMCGSGTIVIERALAGRYALLLCGDSDPAAVRATTENIGPRYKPVEIHRWQAENLPLEDASVSAVVTNLPFGKQIGTAQGNQALYPRVLGELTRVLRGGGRMVLLTSERALMRRSVQQRPELMLERRVPVLVRGTGAEIYVVRRPSGVTTAG